MLKGLYDRVFQAAESRFAPVWLAIVSFAESSFFPIPPDVMLAPMAIARPNKALWYAFICTVASVIGGLAGYAIGAYAYDTIGSYIVAPEKVATFRTWYAEWGALLILVKGLTPIPFKLVTIASGVAGYDLFWFVVLSIITRGARFFMLAGVLNYLGPSARGLIDKHAAAVTVALLGFVIGGFLLVRFVF
jgi:membrane protein YqaA with SNARE-associated domain